jgi:hypothetical protein
VTLTATGALPHSREYGDGFKVTGGTETTVTDVEAVAEPPHVSVTWTVYVVLTFGVTVGLGDDDVKPAGEEVHE